MKSWQEFYKERLDVQKAMEVLGIVGPAVNIDQKEVKVVRSDDDGFYNIYYNVDELRKISQGLIEVANWLELEYKKECKND